MFHDAGLPEELLQIRETTQRFMEKEVLPAEDQVEHDAFELPDELLKPLKARAKEIGQFGRRSNTEGVD
jgi:acyl-CoA dehydrogenase